MYNQYPSVMNISDVDAYSEAKQFAEMIYLLKESGSISDYNEVALLLHSVRFNSECYIEALRQKGIPAYCPRARSFFIQEEIALMVACLARLLCYQEVKQHHIIEHDLLPTYIRESLEK